MAELAAFAKMNGLGNAIIVADMRGRSGRITPEAARHLASGPETRFDQIMAIHDARMEGTENYIEIINSDGSLAQACGNGMRCVVQALAAETGRRHFIFETVAGVLGAEAHENGLISVDMGKPRFGWRDIPLAEEFGDTQRIELQVGPIENPVLHSPSVASMGNPHAVFWVTEDPYSFDLERFGPMLGNHPIFPERANITIARVDSPAELTMRTWERGAGLTRACGSAACAAAVSAARTGRTGRRVTVNLPGGPLDIFWREDDHVIMTGAAEWEFSGRFHPATGVWERETEGAANGG